MELMQTCLYRVGNHWEEKKTNQTASQWKIGYAIITFVITITATTNTFSCTIICLKLIRKNIFNKYTFNALVNFIRW